MDINRNKRPFRHFGRVIDIINIILSLVVLMCAVLVAMDREKYMLLFSVIFLCTGLINLALALKFYKRRETFRAFTLMLGFVVFVAFGIFSAIVVL